MNPARRTGAFALLLATTLLAGCGQLSQPQPPAVPTTKAQPTAPPAPTVAQAKPTTFLSAPSVAPTAAPTREPPRPTSTTATPPTRPAPTATPPRPTAAPAPLPATPALARPAAACRPDAPAVAPKPGRSVTFDRGPAGCNAVALTFDAGADRGYAEQILDTLRQYKTPAAFGMTGAWAEKNQDLVRRMAAEGHQLVNHTWSHRSFTGFSSKARPLTAAERQVELDRTETLLTTLGGRPTKPYFRPPYGDLDDGVLRDVAAAGYDYTIMWTVDSFGWNKLPARGIVDRCLSRAAPGAIYLFHVGAESQDAQALAPIIEGLRAKGLGFVTVEDLLGL